MFVSVRRPIRAAGTALLMLGILGVGRPALAQLTVQVGGAFPDFSALNQDNGPFRLSDHRGKVVILHVCTVWCPPCRDSAAHEQGLTDLLASTVGLENVELVDALVEDGSGGPSDQQDARNWRQRLGTPAETLHANNDRFAELYLLPRTIALEFFPTYFVIRTDGVVSAIEVGFWGESTNTLLASRALDALLETPDGKARVLKFEVNASAVSPGIARGLSAQLDAAIAMLSDDDARNDAAAQAALNAFISVVSSLAGNKIPSDTAAEWIAQAQQLLDEISAGG